MLRIAFPSQNERLQRRYLKMVQAHLKHAPKLAPGVAAIPAASSAFAATQAAWRFLKNQRVTLAALVEPLTSHATSGFRRNPPTFHAVPQERKCR